MENETETKNHHFLKIYLLSFFRLMVRSELTSWDQLLEVQAVLTDTVQACTPVSSRYTPGSRTLWRRESRINNSVDQYLFTIQDDANKHKYYDTETCSCLVTMITSISIITVAHCSITSLSWLIKYGQEPL